MERIKTDVRRKPRKKEKQKMIKKLTEGTNYPNVSRMATDPNSRFSWDLPIPFSALPPEAKKSIDDYLGVVFEQNKNE